MANELAGMKVILEKRALAIGELAYLKASTKAHAMNRLANNKWLYFITCGDAVKADISSYPEERLDVIAVGAAGKLRLLAKIPNLGQRETECHRRLKHLYIYGEWFRYTEEVDALIRELQEACHSDE